MSADEHVSRVGRDAKEDLIVELTPAGEGIEIELNSTVVTFYGPQIREVVKKTLVDVGLAAATVRIEDRGALDWVIQARVEAAAKQFATQLTGESRALPPLAESVDKAVVSRGRLRRSRLYVPGDQADLMLNAGLFAPDAIILDLEDAVAPAQKYAARYLVRNALRAIDFNGAERMVRINQLPLGFEDLDEIAEQPVDTILLPKAERPDQIVAVADEICQLTDRTIWLMPILESAWGIENAFAIATAHHTVAALAFGAEDFTKDIGAERTEAGTESFVARSRLVTAARAAGVQPIDTVYSDVANETGLMASCREAIGLGFDGKGCIHPRQVRVIHQAYRPSETDVHYAAKVKRAMEQAQTKGDGVVAIGSKMIDPPVVARALRVLELAGFYGMDISEGQGGM